MELIKALLSKWKIKRNSKKVAQAIKLVEAAGLTVCEIYNKAGTDYIRASDGSWQKFDEKG